MIGLPFLAIALLWLVFSVFVGLKLPKWLGVQGVARQDGRFGLDRLQWVEGISR